MAVYTCRRCGHAQDTSWDEQCPQCRGFYRPAKTGADSATQRAFATLGGVGAKAKHQYISSGNEGVDKVLGGGFVAGRVWLLGGFAGIGKMRLLLPVVDYVAKTQGNIVYASSEESAEDINSVAAQLGIINDRVTVMGGQCEVEKVLEWAKKLRAFLVVYDSAQKFASTESSGSPGSVAQCKAIGEVIKSYCGETKTCAIVVNQMAASGDLKGGTELEHHCDTVAVLAHPKDDDQDAPKEKDIRVLAGSKNRVGHENQKSYWRMTDAGVMEHVPAREKVVDLAARRRYRRD